MKVLRFFSRLNVGGPTLHVVNLTKGLQEFGIESELVVGRVLDDEGDMSYYAEHKKLSLIQIPEFQAPVNFCKDIVAFLKILKLIHKEKPEVVHTHTFKAGLLGRLAAFLLQVPCRVHTFHGHLFVGYGSSWKARLIGFVEKVLGATSHQVIAVSRQVAEDLVQEKIIPLHKMNVVELGFDVKKIQTELTQSSSLRQELCLPTEVTVVGVIGRMVKVKSFDLFIRAAKPVLEEFEDLHLVLVGEGPEREFLEDLSGGHSRIHFLNFRKKIIRDLKDFDVMVCSSQNEGTSVAIIEGVLAGIPVVSTRVGGMSDLLENGKWGVLVDYNESQLREGIKSLIQKRPTKEFLESASNEFTRRFDEKRLILETKVIYEKILKIDRSPAN